ncbi:MAG: sugar phosphate isomerase/epimerase [Planctomycetia bacterium]|nr:sugar phosphate isomerase/epimerase [Planctomycetia bacterium]
MDLAFSTIAFGKSSLEEGLRGIAEAGFGGVEILADVPHAYPPQIDARRRRDICALLRELRLSVANINSQRLRATSPQRYPSWIEHEEHLRLKRVEHTQQCLVLASQLGAPSVSIEAGGRVPEGTDPRDALRLFRQCLEAVLPVAEQTKVMLLVEPAPGQLMETGQEFEDFFCHGSLGLSLDVAHLFTVGQDPASVIRLLRKHLRHVHLSDVVQEGDHRHLVPGRGNIDYPAVFTALRDIGYDGWVTAAPVERQTAPTEAADEAFRFLQPLL